ncbi:MAG TPA: ATPase [Lachnoclostridium sp.]|jgi:predicted outer membrane protein|uniref:ATPase n=1 Tax=Lacrimispora sp. TaxID=2719234 RepID=UPI000EC95C75|nr:ATPase [Lacrimispora sp.]HCD45512.1 ATPase [Lachnoclostridium sp.]
MDTVIERISEIESAAASIMNDANERKKAFAKDMEEQTAAFDLQLEAETSKKIKELQAGMEISMNNRLKKQRSDSEKVLEAVEQRYEDHHTQYVEELFNTMIKE